SGREIPRLNGTAFVGKFDAYACPSGTPSYPQGATRMPDPAHRGPGAASHRGGGFAPQRGRRSRDTPVCGGAAPPLRCEAGGHPPREGYTARTGWFRGAVEQEPPVPA